MQQLQYFTAHLDNNKLLHFPRADSVNMQESAGEIAASKI